MNKRLPETNESKMKVVGKSAAAVNRVVGILMGVNAELSGMSKIAGF